MKIKESSLRLLIRETILRESFAGYSPGKYELDEMPVGKEVVLAPDPTLRGSYPFVKKMGSDLFKGNTEVPLASVLAMISPSAKSKPEYSEQTLQNTESPVIISVTDFDPKYAKYSPTGARLIPLGDGQFKDVTQLNTMQLIDAMKAWISDNRSARFEIL